MIDRELHTEQCKHVNLLIHESKMKFYSDVINSNNQHVLFLCFGKMLDASAAKKKITIS